MHNSAQGDVARLPSGRRPVMFPRMSATQQLLSEIEKFCQRTGIQPSTLAKVAVGNGKLPDRLRDGGDVSLRTAEQIRAFMASYRGEIRGRRPRART
jgi:hypothetical protein